MFNINNRPGQFFQQHKRRVMWRETAALELGDICSIDMLGTEAETAAGEGVGGITGLDVQDAIFHNAVAVAAGNIDGILLVVTSLLSGGGAQDTEVEVTLCGQRVPARVAGGVDVVIGDRLLCVVDTDNLVKLTTSTDGADVQAIAYALEAYTDAAVILQDVIFFGAMPAVGAGGVTA